MGMLGKAIARYLEHKTGLYSVELPRVLLPEIEDIVTTINAQQSRRALYVFEGSLTQEPPVFSTNWDDLLRWRTDDDRVFVWARGSRQPDSSFQSVVKPFISSRFPGTPTGECSLDLFADICIDELFTGHQGILDPTIENFKGTTYWILGVLSKSFENMGNTLGIHWSDQFLVHWSSVLAHLDEIIKNAAQQKIQIESHHAWDIVRLAGLYVPKRLNIDGGNPFETAPKKVSEAEWSAIAQEWQTIVNDHVLAEGGIEVLLSALDARKSGADKVSAWRGLSWDKVRKVDDTADFPAPIVGAMVFGAENSPSIISSVKPTYPVSPKPSWWGITGTEISDAIDFLKNAQEFAPVATTGISKLQTDTSADLYILELSRGMVEVVHSKRTITYRVTLSGLEIEFKDVWLHVFVSEDEPTHPRDGTAWIKPKNLGVEVTGGKCEVSDIVALDTASNRLLLSFSLSIEYVAKIVDETQSLSAKWNPLRSLNLKIKTKYYNGGQWDADEREIDASCKIIIPSIYSPTLILSKGEKTTVLPERDDEFLTTVALDIPWHQTDTPDVFLREEGVYSLILYNSNWLLPDSRFSTTFKLLIRDEEIDTASPILTAKHYLGDGDTVTFRNELQERDLAVIRLEEKTTSLSSGLLSAVRGLPAGYKPPSKQARASLFGRFQDSIVEILRNSIEKASINSLYQYMLFTGDSSEVWVDHLGELQPVFMPKPRANVTLPGIGNAPPSQILNLPQWNEFMKAIASLCSELGIFGEKAQIWLSGQNPADVTPDTVRRYLQSHRNLILAAEKISPSARFWVSFPFSIFLANGSYGAEFGQLRAILLSPLHPIRFAWSYSVAKIAENVRADERNLIGFAEGWNFPFTTSIPTQVGGRLDAVAVPINPGEEYDFISWGGLVALNNSGLAIPPARAAGFTVPWAGLTGINAKVVDTALRDYLAIHPHLNSVEIDLRATSELPRSHEVDRAVLGLLVGDNRLPEIDQLGGSIRVWDSSMRVGSPPTRDDIGSANSESVARNPFEWRSYHGDVPPYADIAFVENSSINIRVTESPTIGFIGRIPVKRFCPSQFDEQSLTLNQHITPSLDEDDIGLAHLLQVFERDSTGGAHTAIMSYPQTHALGVGEGGKWEIIGTFNLDPHLLSEVIARSSQANNVRLLWEWRPSWLHSSKLTTQGDISRRPYYVIGKVPNSLLKGLYEKQSISEPHAYQLLQILGRHGIGVNSLQTSGGSQESAALGLYYAIQLLISHSSIDNNLKSHWVSPNVNEFFGLLPLDPIEGILEELSGRAFERRCDLVGFKISLNEEAKLAEICFVPIEVKHHGSAGTPPESLPNERDTELNRARQQLRDTEIVLREIIRRLHPVSEGEDRPASIYLRLIAITTLIDLGLSFVSSNIAAQARSKIHDYMLRQQVSVQIGGSILFWFGRGSMTLSGSPCVLKKQEGAKYELFIDPTAIGGLLWNDVSPTPDDFSVREDLNRVIDAVTNCGDFTSAVYEDFTTALSVSIGLSKTIGDSRSVQENSNQIELTETSFDQNQLTVSDSSAPVVPYETPEPSITLQPKALIGWKSWGERWNIIGHMAKNENELVALDLDNPKAMGVFGYMGSGKSYLLGTLIEGAIANLHPVNHLTRPLSVVVFNYRRNATDRFELGSLSLPNTNQTDITKLADIYGTYPKPLQDIAIVCLPGELTPARRQEYGNIAAYELFFHPNSLSVEDWELLMGEPGSNAVFARTIRHTLRELRSQGVIDLKKLEDATLESIRGQSRAAAQLRFDFVRSFLSDTNGLDFANLLKPGRVTIFDLRQPLFNKEDALRFFLVCSNFISRLQGEYNKLIVFDEAHEYLSDEFGEKLESRIRLMRHEGTSYLFATQDVGSVPLSIRRFLGTKFVFNLGTRENVNDLLSFAPEFKGQDLLNIPAGTCLVQDVQSIDNWFMRPRLISIRPRTTMHGGGSRIFS